MVSPTKAHFTVTLDRPPLIDTTISFETVDGSAVAGSDYVATSGSLTFTPGELSKTIDVIVNPDAVDEGNQTFSVKLSASPAVAGMAKDTGTATIVDAPLPQLSIGDTTVAEGDTGTTPARHRRSSP